jgi:hypothetical protein
MNLLNIISEIEKVDPEFQERISPRRDAIKNITSFGSKVAVAALPFAVASIFKKAYANGNAASTPRAVNDVLNFALQLEYFEAYLYNTALAAPGLIKSTDVAYFTTAGTQENDHVAFLKTVLGSAASSPNSSYDLTGKGTFPDVTTNYLTLYAVTQVVEDTGVRAYKGQAGYLAGVSNKVVLTAALSIHAVEARHAAALRQLRATYYGVDINPWITNTVATSSDVSGQYSNDSGVPTADVGGNYGGATAENTTTQGGVNILTLPSIESSSSTSVAVATAAFDEPLTTSEVAAIVLPFGVVVS